MSKANGAKTNGHPRESLYSFPGLTPHELRKVAVEAVCDPRVVVKYLRQHGAHNTNSTRFRIEDALRKFGLERFIGCGPAVTGARPGVAKSSTTPPPR